MRSTNFDIFDVIQFLEGSCQDISSVLPEGMKEDDLTNEDRLILDENIFCCENCGWWWDNSERAEGEMCYECKESN